MVSSATHTPTFINYSRVVVGQTLAIPGLGPLIPAGPVMATLTGVGSGGVVGGVIGALSGMGIPECEAKPYEGRVEEGGILVSVQRLGG